jgi:hypothetical protein
VKVLVQPENGALDAFAMADAIGKDPPSAANDRFTVVCLMPGCWSGASTVGPLDGGLLDSYPLSCYFNR